MRHAPLAIEFLHGPLDGAVVLVDVSDLPPVDAVTEAVLLLQDRIEARHVGDALYYWGPPSRPGLTVDVSDLARAAIYFP
jgi:hypothetical protein